jgi:broad specificity phosphatase PhoE
MSEPHIERRRVYLMRHAEVSYFSETGAPLDPRHVSLTENGQRQAEQMAAALADVSFDRAVCSGVRRSRETARAVLAGRAVPIEDEPNFREIKAGRLREERVLAALKRLLSDPGWRRLLIVAHDAVNRVLLAWAAQSGLSAIGAFEQDMASLNLIDLDIVEGVVERRIIRLMNYTPYDAVKAKLFLTSMEQVFGEYVSASA